MIICVYVYILYYIPSASPVQHPDTSARGPCRARHLLGNVSPEHGSSVGEPRIPRVARLGFGHCAWEMTPETSGNLDI